MTSAGEALQGQKAEQQIGRAGNGGRRPERKERGVDMDLRNDMRQKNTQIILDFHSQATGEPRLARGEGTESLPTVHAPESPASTNQLMEEVCERENLKQALKQVKGNKGSPGIDGMTVEQLPGYLQQHWPAIRQQLLAGTYEPKPVRRVEIEKPDGGGMRKLGIPTVAS
jgi:RNA-directed DNA polymerase